MPIDYRRLVDGLSQAAAAGRWRRGRAGRDRRADRRRAGRDAGGRGRRSPSTATAAAGSWSPRGDMSWTLGQPIAGELVDPPDTARAWAGRVDAMPVPVAEPLLSRGVVAMAGYPVRTPTACGRRGPPVLRRGRRGAVAGGRDRCCGSSPARSARCSPRRSVRPTAAPRRTTGRCSWPWPGTSCAPRSRWSRATPACSPTGGTRSTSSTAGRPPGCSTQRADELARLVDRLLGASVGDGTAGWLVRTVPFDPLETLLRAAADLPAELRRVVRLELPNSLPPALGDPVTLASVVTELVTNAVRATHGPRRRCRRPVWSCWPGRTRTRSSSGSATGARASTPTDAERAFERFWRARRGGESRGGVGLGLYLVRRLVERQNGWVSLRPREGGGAVAEVRLPRADGPLRPASGEARRRACRWRCGSGRGAWWCPTTPVAPAGPASSSPVDLHDLSRPRCWPTPSPSWPSCSATPSATPPRCPGA